MDHFAGLDVSVKEMSVCIVDDTGRIVRELKVASEPEAALQVLTNPAYLSLLKNELRAIGWGQGERAAAPISGGSTLIAMMQTAHLGEGNNIACGGKLHATRTPPCLAS
jgi:hypothetical protein